MEKKIEVFELDFTREFEQVDFSNVEMTTSKGRPTYACEECK